MKQAYIQKNFSASSLEVIETANQIIENYAAVTRYLGEEY